MYIYMNYTLYYIIRHSETTCMPAQRQSSAGIWEVPWLHAILNSRIGSAVQSVGLRDQAHHHSRIVDYRFPVDEGETVNQDRATSVLCFSHLIRV